MELLNSIYGHSMNDRMGFAKNLVPKGSTPNAGPANFNDANKVPLLRLDSTGEATSDEEFTTGVFQQYQYNLPMSKSAAVGYSQFGSMEDSTFSHPLCQWSTGEAISLCTTAHKMYSRLPNPAMDSSQSYSYVFPAQGSRYMFTNQETNTDMQRIAAKSTLNPNAPAWFPSGKNSPKITTNVETSKSETITSLPSTCVSLEMKPGIEVSVKIVPQTLDLVVDSAAAKCENLVLDEENKTGLDSCQKNENPTMESITEETKPPEMTQTSKKEVTAEISVKSAKKETNLSETSTATSDAECSEMPQSSASISESIPSSHVQSLPCSSPPPSNTSNHDLSLVRSPPSNFAMNFFLLPQQDDTSDCDSGWDDEDEDDDDHDVPPIPLNGLHDPLLEFSNHHFLCPTLYSSLGGINEDFASIDLSDVSCDLQLEEVNSKWQDAYCDIEPCSKATKVSFPADCSLSEVYPVDPNPEMEQAYAECRKGPWEEYARDHQRFQNRIKSLDEIIAPCLDSEHRRKILAKLTLDE